jgi:hypothetical protein
LRHGLGRGQSTAEQGREYQWLRHSRQCQDSSAQYRRANARLLSAIGARWCVAHCHSCATSSHQCRSALLGQVRTIQDALCKDRKLANRVTIVTNGHTSRLATIVASAGVTVNGEQQLSTILSRKSCSIMVRPFALTILLIGIFDWSRLGMLYSATAFRPLSISFSVDLLWRGLLLTGSFWPTVARLGRVQCSDHLLGRSSCAVVTEDALLLWQSLLLLQRPMERFILMMKQ